jgi:hypothetical protein
LAPRERAPLAREARILLSDDIFAHIQSHEYILNYRVKLLPDKLFSFIINISEMEFGDSPKPA